MVKDPPIEVILMCSVRFEGGVKGPSVARGLARDARFTEGGGEAPTTLGIK